MVIGKRILNSIHKVTQLTESDKAVARYSQTPKEYNCAQAVAKAFGRDDLATSLKSCGGGRAEGGICGALHSALLLVSEDKRKAMKEQFREKVGDILCKTIRQEGKTPCTECVRIAAALVAGHD